MIDTSIATLEVFDDILHITLKQDACVEVESVREVYEVRNKLQEGKPMLVYADIRLLWHASVEARALAARKKMSDLNVAQAIHVGSLATRMLANFFIKFNNPATPTKMFNSKEEAITWLKSFK